MSVYSGKVAEPLDRGRTITIRGFDFVVPELVLGDREEFEEDGTFEAIEDVWEDQKANQPPKTDPPTAPSREQVKAVRVLNRKSNALLVKVVAVAMKRNYPDITEDFVKKEFSQSALYQAYAAASGFKLKGDEEAAGTTSGEA